MPVVVSRGVGREVGRGVVRGVGRGVAWLARGVGSGVGSRVAVTAVLLGSFGAAGLVTWAPAREIADQTLTVAAATMRIQTTAQTIMGSPRLIRPSCRIVPGPVA